MKEKIIEAAGKTWKALGEKGQVSVAELPKIVNEQEPIVYQALGWLAREDKINYSIKNKSTFVGLVEGEMQAFKSVIEQIQNQQSAPAGVNLRKTKKKAG